MPIPFVTMRIAIAHVFRRVVKQELTLGTYVLFSVFRASASHIAVPTVQRLAIPEASPTLQLEASLGLTFSFNVTIGIPMSIEIAQYLMRKFPAI